MANKVECRKFQCCTMSIAQLFGRTPKIEFICDECGTKLEREEYGD